MFHGCWKNDPDMSKRVLSSICTSLHGLFIIQRPITLFACPSVFAQFSFSVAENVLIPILMFVHESHHPNNYVDCGSRFDISQWLDSFTSC
ncbi:hypothetical protein GDO78_006067 [Eleutherodactylus coqui]|uniref:Uncharacterized protein n=1 Tax=Eleutherodactylus coqui TaxID=57060 RepID=A0A8J6FM66_ELECQ|nr:hypothetical protein GDO78_006067 [Eleutherodactylus coqui]